MKNDINKILRLAEELTAKKQEELVEQILKLMNKSDINSCNNLVYECNRSVLACPHCKTKAELCVIKKGKNRNGAQRYYCKKCRKFFVPSTNTVFERTKKESDVWRKFISLTISGASLKKCAVECGLAYQTAFTWRHKVLNAFVQNQGNTTMNGVVEIDEMLIPISYKGNHVKGGFESRRLLPGIDNGLPRESYKRGTDNRSKSATDKACVFCMVEDGKKCFYASVPGIGFMSNNMLKSTIEKHINKQTALILADKYKITRKFLEENNYKHKILATNISDNHNEHKPEIHGKLHMQHVNSMHRHVRRFLAGYCGVSSKYLENYVALYVWLKSVECARNENALIKASISRTATADCYLSRKEIEGRPALPTCA